MPLPALLMPAFCGLFYCGLHVQKALHSACHRYNGNMKSKIHASIKMLLCSLPLTGAGLATAELADRTKPMHIEADSMRYDDINKVTNATGRVIGTKGTMLLRADAVEIRQDAQGNSTTVATSNAGNQVFMRQKREGLNEFFEAQANRIERDDKTLIARLSGKAKMRRLVGNTLADEIEGENMVYNEVTEVYQVTGGTPAASTTPGGIPAGRVRATIAPQSTTPAQAAPAAGKAAQRSAITLQPSAQIGAGQ